MVLFASSETHLWLNFFKIHHSKRKFWKFVIVNALKSTWLQSWFVNPSHSTDPTPFLKFPLSRWSSLHTPFCTFSNSSSPAFKKGGWHYVHKIQSYRRKQEENMNSLEKTQKVILIIIIKEYFVCPCIWQLENSRFYFLLNSNNVFWTALYFFTFLGVSSLLFFCRLASYNRFLFFCLRNTSTAFVESCSI